MRFLLVVSVLPALCGQASGQTRAELAAKYGAAHAEIFLLPHQIRLTATYDNVDRVCAYLIETTDHAEHLSPNMTDVRFWIDSNEVTRLIAELVPEGSRHGPVQTDTVGLRVGEQILIEADDTVQITRIQRSPRLVKAPSMPVADRLVTIKWKRCP